MNTKRFRSFGFSVGFLPAGPKNTIADVRGVLVGHATKIQGKDIRTGVTIVDPGVPDLYRKKIPAAVAVGNGAGKVAGFTQVEEFGTLEAPIALTNTLAVGPVTRGVVDIILSQNRGMRPYETVNVVVGEANDWIVNNVHNNSIVKSDVARAYRARSARVAMGNVGAGTGMRAFSWKGGIGSASRVIEVRKKKYTLGALVQTNYGGSLTMLGVQVGRMLDAQWSATPAEFMREQGSCVIVLAADAPLTSRQLKRIAARTFLALGKTGAVMAHGSGDYAIAFTTSRIGLEGSGAIGACLADETLNPFFEAAVEATEESVYDALFCAETMQGRAGNTLRALPVEEVVAILRGKR
jgi:D-aminopeptidase